MTTLTMQHAGTTLKPFISRSQALALGNGLAGEESDWFAQIITDYAARIQTMPQTYQTEDQADPLVYLHYFRGGWDWFITEKDSDPDGEGQLQAFGLVRGFEEELGYINLPEILAAGAELDLHWTPKPLSAVRST